MNICVCIFVHTWVFPGQTQEELLDRVCDFLEFLDTVVSLSKVTGS